MPMKNCTYDATEEQGFQSGTQESRGAGTVDLMNGSSVSDQLEELEKMDGAGRRLSQIKFMI